MVQPAIQQQQQQQEQKEKKGKGTPEGELSSQSQRQVLLHKHIRVFASQFLQASRIATQFAIYIFSI